MTAEPPASHPSEAGSRRVSSVHYLRLEGIRKSFGRFEALHGHRPGDRRRASSSASSAPRAAARRRCCASSPASRRRPPARIVQGGRDISRAAAGRARLRHRVPVVRAVSQPHDRRQRRLRPRQPPQAPRRRSTARVDELLKLVGLPGSGRQVPGPAVGRPAAAHRARARARDGAGPAAARRAAVGARRARARAPARRDPRAAAALGVTTIMVTHDQEEALSMADRIVVMNQGVIEQVGTPCEVYRDPATPFVADFVGKINVLPAGCTRAATLRVGASRFACDARHRRRARRQALPASRGRPGAADRATATPNVFDGAGRQDRVPRRVLPRARQRSTAIGAQPLMVYLSLNYLAELGARGRQPRCRCGCCPSAMRVSSRLTSRPVVERCPPSHARARTPLRQRAHWHGPPRARGAARCCALALVVFLALPLRRSWSRRAGQGGAFVGLANFASYFATPALRSSIWNSVWVSALVTAITVPLAFVFAYALTRTCMPVQGAVPQHRADRRSSRRRCWRRSRSSSGSATRASLKGCSAAASRSTARPASS